jgi:hypothetical protein
MQKLFEPPGTPCNARTRGGKWHLTSDHMPPAESNFVQECRRYSAEAEAIAASASDQKTRAAFLEIARRWLSIADAYEAEELLIRTRFTGATMRRA